MKKDILVIGTGTSGYTVAHGLKKAGRSVAIADRRSFGGTCAKRGCQPKKIFSCKYRDYTSGKKSGR